MAVLIEAGLVKARRTGRWVQYRLAGEAASPVAQDALAWLAAGVGEDERIRQDRALLATSDLSPDSCCRD
jgi:DNA-binding transcriptional ArsR family regulator